MLRSCASEVQRFPRCRTTNHRKTGSCPIRRRSRPRCASWPRTRGVVMAFELKMPKLGESVTEGTIGKWLKQPGDKVNKYDLLVEVQTDKVNTEIPSPVAGTLKEVKVQEGQTVPIGTLLAVFDTADGEVSASTAAAQPAPSAAPTPPAAEPPKPSQRAGAQRSAVPEQAGPAAS